MTTTLELQSVAFAYDHQNLLQDISLQIQAGQIGCLLGPSGCGKSTLLRLVAGFEQPRSGDIFIDQQLIANAQHHKPPQERQVGMLFQDLALFPHLSVRDNIAYGLQALGAAERQNRIKQLLDLCRIQGHQSKFPHQLSGGQKQRVALARAMAPKPKLILLDEPFSSVDTGLQGDLALEVKSMLQADQSTALWVTHSIDEAFAVADQMGVMLSGQLRQWSSPHDLYETPAHPAVVTFLNHANLVSGQCTKDGQIETPLGTLSLANPEQFTADQKVQIGIPKHHIKVTDATPNAVVSQTIYQGDHHLITATLNQGGVVQWPQAQALSKQQAVALQVGTKQGYVGFADPS
ncbi:ABC transporter ATP-binding protein [Marinicella meishanensis]|uniref:ABC transporter ATP-binding protein n=1 Tax=Marinicella meishanensis TaxID=2873263 RepID=UPI001CC0A303|nr:ABC transporter ATP-binding protein [Marinicella sp. NBU2979]